MWLLLSRLSAALCPRPGWRSRSVLLSLSLSALCVLLSLGKEDQKHFPLSLCCPLLVSGTFSWARPSPGRSSGCLPLRLVSVRERAGEQSTLCRRKGKPAGGRVGGSVGGQQLVTGGRGIGTDFSLFPSVAWAKGCGKCPGLISSLQGPEPLGTCRGLCLAWATPPVRPNPSDIDRAGACPRTHTD